MREKRTPAALILPVAALAIPFGNILGLPFDGETRPIVVVALLGMAVLVSWRLVPQFFLTIVVGAFAGAMAGAVILGPGFRIAMRIVAVLEPTRITEFTVGGTFFIIAGIGGVLGAMIGLASVLIRRGLGLARLGGAVVATTLVMAFLVADSELRSELFGLGVGGWMNAPMFGAIAACYGYATQRLWEKFKEVAIKETNLAEISS